MLCRLFRTLRCYGKMKPEIPPIGPTHWNMSLTLDISQCRSWLETYTSGKHRNSVSHHPMGIVTQQGLTLRCRKYVEMHLCAPSSLAGQEHEWIYHLP